MKRGTLLKILRQSSIELFFVKYHHLPLNKACELSEAKKIGLIVFPEAIEYKRFEILNLNNKDMVELIRLIEKQIMNKFKTSLFPIKRFKWKNILKRRINYYEKQRELL